MLVLVGLVIVVGSVLGGFVLEKGNLHVLFQPAELIIIFGSSFGAFLISAKPKVVSQVARNLTSVVSSKGYGKQNYIEILTLLFHLFSRIRKEGLISVEADIENPGKSPFFTKHASALANKHAIEFICDNLKVIIASNVPSHELESLMELEIETRHHDEMVPSHLVSKTADALPGLGIVAAVLGVVLTMSNIDKPPAVLGHSIGAALVGTFLGVFMCYGVVGPIATTLEAKVKEDTTYFNVIKVAMVAFVRGAAPQMAVEFGRRAIPGAEKPSFDELEKAVRGAKP